MNRRLTVIVEREGNGYMALCPEVDVASQGGDVAEAFAFFFEVRLRRKWIDAFTARYM